MFEILGEFFGAGLILVFGWLACFKPHIVAGRRGQPREVEKNVRFMKRIGLFLLVCGSLMLACLAVQLFRRF